MNYNTKFTAIAMALLIVSIALPSIASAQVSSITFSRPLTMDTSLSSIEFGFGILDDVDVQIDQLGAVNALFVNNDAIGTDLGIFAGGPVASVGVVTIGQVLNQGDNFGSDGLDLAEAGFSPGDDFFLGFGATTGEVGFFNVFWEPQANGSIFFSSGQFAAGTASLTVAAVPEPTSVVVICGLAIAGLVRRRRD